MKEPVQDPMQDLVQDPVQDLVQNPSKTDATPANRQAAGPSFP